MFCGFDEVDIFEIGPKERFPSWGCAKPAEQKRLGGRFTNPFLGKMDSQLQNFSRIEAHEAKRLPIPKKDEDFPREGKEPREPARRFRQTVDLQGLWGTTYAQRFPSPFLPWSSFYDLEAGRERLFLRKRASLAEKIHPGFERLEAQREVEVLAGRLSSRTWRTAFFAP